MSNWPSRDDLNPKVLEAEYAVRGELAIKAGELSARLANGEKFPFERIIYCNIGNPQQLNQPPITFFRQVLALVQCPWLLHDKGSHLSFPEDAKARARLISSKFASLGAYTHSKGLQFVRENITKFIEARDGRQADPEHIFLTNGASEGIKRVLQCMISSDKSGILLPIPQYPLYSAAVTMLGGAMVPYYLDEENNWNLTIEELRRAANEARSKGIEIKVLCLINPGNPTGNHYTVETLKAVARFCQEERVLLLADEVYQSNIYDSQPFVSMKKIVCDLGLDIPLVSVHSTSKGFIGECGKRSGYMECHNIADPVLAQMYKLASVELCPNVDGQLIMDLMVSPPKEGDLSFGLYEKEIRSISESMHRRAIRLTEALNALEGVACCKPAGAMYLFPRILFPQKFIDEAHSTNRHPDDLYCLRLIEATGICVVPGSGFGQRPGTYHVRLTCLPAEEYFTEFIDLLSTFHRNFMAFYTT